MHQPLVFADYEHDDVVSSLATVSDFVRWAASCFKAAELSYGHGYAGAIDEALALVLYAVNLTAPVAPEMLQARLTKMEKNHVIALVGRRLNEQIPLAYITQQAWFAGLEFYVDERVLVPRSPIAELIEQGFVPWAADNEIASVLDLCCGSGCIGIACAYAFPQATVDLADISPAALEVAAINIEGHQLQDRVTMVQSDVFAALGGRRYDLIVSNPPYVPESSYAELAQEYLHEPALGLLAGPEGLLVVDQILAQAARHLTEEGLLCVEVGEAREALELRWPEVPFVWPEFERGGGDVLLLSAVELRRYFSD